MSYGNCCLSSDIPENREVMEGYGYTFKNRGVEDLRERLSYLLAHPEEVKGMKATAREHVLNTYSWDHVTDRMEQLYLSILKTPCS